eukprot:4532859-Pyramimonas_sp.AAC.1
MVSVGGALTGNVPWSSMESPGMGTGKTNRATQQSSRCLESCTGPGWLGACIGSTEYVPATTQTSSTK